uniref:Hesp-417 n=1 Tax=Melampsora lini TaxID=5261 RepID=Q2MV37_MELLI|nr:hesp-417 [Melampsora lini]
MLYLLKSIALLGCLFHCVTFGQADYKCYTPRSTGIRKKDCVAAINSFPVTHGKLVHADTVLEAKNGTCNVILAVTNNSKTIVTTKSGALNALDQVFTLCRGYGTVLITNQTAHESAVELYAGVPTN